jgi:hypothetical protein
MKQGKGLLEALRDAVLLVMQKEDKNVPVAAITGSTVCGIELAGGAAGRIMFDDTCGQVVAAVFYNNTTRRPFRLTLLHDGLLDVPNLAGIVAEARGALSYYRYRLCLKQCGLGDLPLYWGPIGS